MNLFNEAFGESSEETRGEPDHFSSESPVDRILMFQHSIQKPIEWATLNDVEFAMWLPCEEDNLFASSPITDKWTVAYSIIKFHWSYITAGVLKTLNLMDDKIFRIGLPDDFHAYSFLATENEQIVLSLSKEKGIRFHFAETTPLQYRVSFMDNFVSYCNAWKELVEQNDGEKDDDLGFEGWWLSTLETSKAVEENEPLIGVGKIIR